MRTCLAFVAVLSLVSCKSSKPQPKDQSNQTGSNVATGSGGAGSGSAAGSADPWHQPDPKPATPEEKRKRAEAAIARVATIQPKLAALRGLPMDTPVPAELQSPDDFRKFVQRELAKELPAEKAAKMAAAYHHIGLFTKPVDLGKVLEQTMTSQAAAYYDPATKKFFVVMAPDNDMMIDTISAHELTHALQDHHFDLPKYMPGTLNDDESAARRFIVEGDATFAMIAYLAAQASGGKDLQPAMMKVLKTQIETMANMSVSEYGDMMKQQAGALGGMDPDMKASMESMGELPPIIIQPMIDAYMKGAVVSMVAYENGGWKAVDALYKQPPESTEQVLHPAEKLIGKRDKPKQITLPPLPKGDELIKNVVGELQWRVYLQQWGVAKPEAAAGWGGDRYAVIKREDGTHIGFIATTWDTPKDATEFAQAYVATLAKRFPGAETSKPEAGVARTDKGKVFVRVKGAHVFIVDGGDDPKALDLLAKAKIK